MILRNLERKRSIHRLLDYPIAFFATLSVGLFYFCPWEYSKRFIFPSGTDWVWQQAIFQMHGQVGLFGVTKNLSWPIGADPWRLPQLGMLMGGWARVTVGWFGIGTATSIVLFLSVAAAVNSLALIYFIRGLVGVQFRIVVVLLAVMFSASLFTFTHQLNLASFFIIPLSFGILCRIKELQSNRKYGSLGLLVLVAMLSPLWWVVVLALIFPLVAFGHVIRRDRKAAGDTATVWASILLGLMIQTILFKLAASNGPGADTSRLAWTSNYFAGHLSDLFVGSTSIQHHFSGFASKLLPGSSLEISFGIPILVGGLASVIALISLPPRQTSSGVRLEHLTTLTFVTLLFWLGGGLGNLQAAFAVFLGTVSPARAWYRMLLILGILGLAWLLVALEQFQESSQKSFKYLSKILPVVLVVIFVVGGIDDLKHIDRRWNYNRASAEQTSTPVVDFIRKNTKPCLVAQFPNEAIPNVRIALNIADPRTYRGMIPYILEPNYNWTSGSYDPEKIDGLAKYPVVITDSEISQLKSEGYCAVLFDREMGQLAIDQQVVIEGREILTTRQPDYEDQLYKVFIL